jgi:hypothetical protein
MDGNFKFNCNDVIQFKENSIWVLATMVSTHVLLFGHPKHAIGDYSLSLGVSCPELAIYDRSWINNNAFAIKTSSFMKMVIESDAIERATEELRKMNKGCTHNYVAYTGLLETFKYCEKCGEKM